MEFKGTKGNWQISNNGFCFDIETCSPYNWLICTTFTEEEQDAYNIQLISCAQEMLEMLIKTNETLLNDSLSVEQIKLRKEIEKLIKKATTI